MRMNVRRAGVAVLVSALVTTLMSTTQAGVIPWLYDAIFGPAYPHPYAGYGAGWGYSCAPAPCGPCQVGYAPRAVTPCATGVCATAAYYGPVRSTCPTTVACRGNGDAEVGKLAPEPDSLPPAPRTFDDAPVPDPATRDLEHSQPKVSGVAAPDTANDSTDAGFGTGTRGEAAEGEFAPPVVRPESGAEAPAGSPADPNAGQNAPEADTGTDLGLDNRTSWSAPVSRQRIAMRPAFRNARIARSVRTLEVDFVIPVRSATQIAGR